MKKTELETLEKGLTQTVTEYNNIPLTDADKGKTLSILEKETKIISGENKSIFDEELSMKRFELEKDKVYSSQKLDDKKFEQDVKQKTFDNNIKQQELELSKLKMENDRKMALIQEQSRKNEQIFRYVSLGVTAVTTLTGIIVPLIAYSRLAKTNLYHIYKQEGRSTKEFDEAIRNVKTLIRK